MKWFKPRKMLISTGQKLWRHRIGLSAGLAFMLLNIISVSSLIFLGNAEYHGRSAQFIDVSNGETDGGATATLVLHRIVTDENAIEASVLVRIPSEFAEKHKDENAPCFQVYVGDRSNPDEQVFRSEIFPIYCKKLPFATVFLEDQTPRFMIPATQSVSLFPFDELIVVPDIKVAEQGTYFDFLATYYRIGKALPGKIVTFTGDKMNWEIHLSRSTNEKIIVQLAATLFVILSLFVSWQLAQPRKEVGTQDMVAVAGFIIAAAGFRDMLGVTRTIGTSFFELAVFGLPLIILTLSIFVGHVRGWLQARQAAT